MVNGEVVGLKVLLGEKFHAQFKNFPKNDRLIILNFAQHIEQKGFEGLQGRNKSSDDVPKDDPNWRVKVQYAQEHHLWHYHIGIVRYDETKPFGDQTSEYVLHYMRGESDIKIVDFSAHPPFTLPNKTYLK